MALLKHRFLSRFFSPSSRYVAKQLSSILGFRPVRLELYQRALRHKSLGKGEANFLSNERLEFLGDALLNAVVSEYLYKRFPKRKEGELSRMRTRLVNRNFLNDLALELGVDQLLETDLGENENPRAIYGNALEALIGAVYLDKGYRRVNHFILEHLLQMDDRYESLGKVKSDDKSRLIEWSQKNKVSVSFEAEAELFEERWYVVQLKVGGEIATEGKGLTKKEAEQAAAAAFFKKQK